MRTMAMAWEPTTSWLCYFSTHPDVAGSYDLQESVELRKTELMDLRSMLSFVSPVVSNTFTPASPWTLANLAFLPNETGSS